MQVAIIYGSESDTPKMDGAFETLKKFNVPYTTHILSAHRAPDKLSKTIKLLNKNGCDVIIAAAGLAAHLPGVIASQTTIPVIGVPISAAIHGLDALLSIVQMPKGIPVATVGIDNSTNAAMLAIQIMALKNTKLKNELKKYREDMQKKILIAKGV